MIRVSFEKMNLEFIGDGMGKIIITGSLNVDTVNVSTYNTTTFNEYKLNFPHSYHLYRTSTRWWSTLATRTPSTPTLSANSTSLVASLASSTSSLATPSPSSVTVSSSSSPASLTSSTASPTPSPCTIAPTPPTPPTSCFALHHQRERRVPHTLLLKACSPPHVPWEAMEGVLVDSVP
uniref:Uncharacterized protein n=1 Tax=Musa balbisiana TaxID=52838 RepID=Q1EP56_MUSBA|nr:hypothetical protein MBP_81C12.42 [Musa balbisiana]